MNTKKRIGFIAMSGVRAHNPELTKLGLTLPGFVDRNKIIASLPSLGLLTLAGQTPDRFEISYHEIADLKKVASGVPPAVEPGFQPGGTDTRNDRGARNPETSLNANASPGGRMPPSTAGADACRYRYFVSEKMHGTSTGGDFAIRCMAMISEFVTSATIASAMMSQLPALKTSRAMRPASRHRP